MTWKKEFKAVRKPLRVIMLLAGALLWAGLDGSAEVAQPAASPDSVSGETFTNPLLPNGADPWVIWWKGD